MDNATYKIFKTFETRKTSNGIIIHGMNNTAEFHIALQSETRIITYSKRRLTNDEWDPFPFVARMSLSGLMHKFGIKPA